MSTPNINHQQHIEIMSKIAIEYSRYTLILFFILVSILGLAQIPQSPQTNSSNSTNGCSTSFTLSAYSLNAPSGLTHKWYLSQSGSQTITPTVSSNTPPGTYATELTVSQTATYWVAARSSSGQESSRTRVMVTFTTPDTSPPTLSLGYDGEKCPPTATFTIGAGGGGSGSTYRWYATSNTSGTPIFTGSSYQVTLTYSHLQNGEKTYWVRATMTSTNCFTGTRTETKSITVRFRTPAPAPSASDKERCGPGALSLTASGAPSGASYRWYAPNGSIVQTSTSSSYLTPSLNATANYQVSIILSGCEGTKTSVSAIILNSTSPPIVDSNKENICGLNTINLDAVSPITSGLTHKWYTTATGPNTDPHQVTSTVGQYVTSIIVDSETKTYWVASVVNGCESNRVSTTATYTPNETIPTLTVSDVSTNTNRCGSGNFILVAEGGNTGSVYKWYDDAFATIEIHTGANYQPTVTYAETDNGTKRLWIDGTLTNDQGCAFTITQREFIDVTVDPLPYVPTGVDVERCGPGTLSLTASNSNTAQLHWYDVMSGGSILSIGSDFTTPTIIESTTYYVESYFVSTGCTSAMRQPINALVLTPMTWYLDADNDGFAVSTILSCNPGPNYTQTVLPLTDCDDTNATINPNTIWYLDNDYDNLGDPDMNNSFTGCIPPGSNYALNMMDQCPDIYTLENDCNPITHDPEDLNYVYKRSYQNRSQSPIDPQFFTGNDNLIQSITYFDGLGRQIQNIGVDQTPNKEDIITFIDYDEYGRVVQEYLPYGETDNGQGNYRQLAESKTLAQYNTQKYQNTSNPYAQSAFENSPLNRLLKHAAPGDEWKMGEGHEIEFDYSSNIAADNIRRFRVDLSFSDNTYLPSLVLDGVYDDGELTKVVTFDENHTSGTDHSTIEFKDKLGKLILKRTFNDSDPHDTQYVYDDYGNLSFVLPPNMEPSTTSLAQLQSNMDALGYRYIYDQRNRSVINKVPGSGEEYIIWNTLDQPMMTQDENQRLVDEWLFTKYDEIGRIAYTGKVVNTESRENIQSTVNSLTVNPWVTRGTGYIFNSMEIGYDNGAFPNNGVLDIFTINFYDNYDFDLNGIPIPTDPIYEQGIAANVQGLGTGTKSKVLGTDQWITDITFFDSKGRPIFIFSKNEYLQTLDSEKIKRDFNGRGLISRTSHTRNDNTIITINNFMYDHVGRLLAHTQCIGDESLGDVCEGLSESVPDTLVLSGTIDGDQKAKVSIEHTNGLILPENGGDNATLYDIDPNAASGSGKVELIVRNTYDNLGRIESRHVGGVAHENVLESPGLQSTTYKYNIRGWLISVNDQNLSDQTLTIDSDDLFGFKIHYTDPENGGSPLFNGNIAQTSWRTQNGNKDLHSYNYTYDAIDRISSATDNFGGNYNLSDVTYDKSGNIKGLTRTGHTNVEATSFGIMDQLTYSYDNNDNGNQLMKVADSAPIDGFGFKDDAVNITLDSSDDYQYDANGNMTSDTNKGIIDISYNYLNLPLVIQVSDNGINNAIEYTYDAIGIKLQKTVNDHSKGIVDTTDYAGNYIYQNGRLQVFEHPTGYVFVENGLYKYVYNFTDHLGNVRLSYQDVNNDGEITASTDPNVNEIIEENNYYPFGGLHKGYNNQVSLRGNAEAKKWKYNGKEFDESLHIDSYDYGVRNYDPWVGRWKSIDPLADSFEGSSPYSYAFNTPIQAYDPDGRLIIFVNGLLFSDAVSYKINPINVLAALVDSKYAYNPSRRFFYDEEPTFNGTKVKYWGEEDGNIDQIFKSHYADEHSIYINGTDDFYSSGQDRFAQGMESAEELIRKLESGTITLAEGETIKIVGHSQGAAFAAGMVSVLAQHQKYGSKVEAGIYLAPHQPGEFTHPYNIQGYQYTTLGDAVSSSAVGGGGLIGIALTLLQISSAPNLINGVQTPFIRESHDTGKKGHNVGTWEKQLRKDFPTKNNGFQSGIFIKRKKSLNTLRKKKKDKTRIKRTKVRKMCKC